ncbi:MAG: ABC transporter ATP-binding protein, partial [Cyanobacteria bacterium J06623_1]
MVEAAVQSDSSARFLLQATGLSKSFGGIKAVNNACLEVDKGSITGW